MTKRRKPPVKGRGGDSGRQASRPGDVGYGRPPKASRFKKGQSGNPKGRPKGRKNFTTRIAEIMNSSVTKREGDRTAKVSLLDALVLKQVENGLKGNDRSFNAVMKLRCEGNRGSRSSTARGAWSE
jgi:hypothetical protein